MTEQLKPAYVANFAALSVVATAWLTFYFLPSLINWMNFFFTVPLVVGVFVWVITLSVFWQVGFKSVPWSSYLLFLVQPIIILLSWHLLLYAYRAI